MSGYKKKTKKPLKKRKGGKKTKLRKPKTRTVKKVVVKQGGVALPGSCHECSGELDSWSGGYDHYTHCSRFTPEARENPMHNMNPYRRKRGKSAADEFLEFEEYAEDEVEGLGGAMTQLSAYELNPRHIGRGPRQRSFGAGGGYTDARGRFHPGGGRYLDPNYLPADYPDGTYHPGGGQVSRGYHPGSGYFSNNPPCGCGANCGCGCGGDARFCSCPVARNPGRGPVQREWGAGGGHYDRSGWHAGGGRYVDPGYLPSDYPEDEYHPGGGHVIGRGHRKSFWPGSGYSSNPYGGSMLDDMDYGSPYQQNPYGGSMLDDGSYASPYASNPYLRRPPRDLSRVPAYNNPAPYAPAAFGYGHLPYAARVAPGLVTLANPPRHYCPNCGYDL